MSRSSSSLAPTRKTSPTAARSGCSTRRAPSSWPAPPRTEVPKSVRGGDELLEPGILAERVEVGVDLQPAGRKVVRDLQQRLELVESLLRLASENVDPDELVLIVGTEVGILRDRRQSDASQALPDRLLLPIQVGEGETEGDVPR